MRRLLSLSRHFGSVAAIAGVLIAARYTIDYLAHVSRCEVVCDPRMGEMAAHYISYTARALCERGKIHPQKIVSEITQNLPFVQNVSVVVEPQHRARVSCKMYDPVCRINDGQILLSNGLIADMQFIKAESVNSLPSVQVAEWCLSGTQAPDGLLTFLSGLDVETLAEYSVDWRGEHEVALRSRFHKDVLIVVSGKEPPGADLLTQCHQLVKHLSQQELVHKRRDTLVADARFKDQIILSLGGGKRHGSRTF